MTLRQVLSSLLLVAAGCGGGANPPADAAPEGASADTMGTDVQGMDVQGIDALADALTDGAPTDTPRSDVTQPDVPVVPPTGFPFPTWTPEIPTVPPSTTGRTYYVDVRRGADSNAGTTPDAAFATIAHAITLVAAGDTVLLRAGLYREGINLQDAPSGTADRPITFGSYGDGEVIVDGSTHVGPWTAVSGTTVYRAPIAFAPIAVVVNEVPLRQVRQGQMGSIAPVEGLAGVTPGSGRWYVGGGYVYADMQSTLGTGDPNAADIVVPSDDGGQTHVFFSGDYYRFIGLTVRGSGSNGIWGYGSHITVERCNIKFNGKAAVSFQGEGDTDNAVLLTHAYHNVLLNWPRGNNGFAESGGGWAGAVSWATNLRPLARGNVVHRNGGEGIISYGTAAGHPSGYALFEQNVVYDNWSVDMYFDNQPHDTARNNLIFNHPPDPADYFYVGAYPFDGVGRASVCIMLADEENSSDATGNYANLTDTSVYNNVLAGCRIAVRDYAEGDAHAVRYHGMRNTLIANNTIVMPFAPLATGDVMGIFIQDNVTPGGTNRNSGSVIANNIVVGYNRDPVVWSEYAGRLQGIALDHNLYFSAAPRPLRAGNATVTDYDLAGWRALLGAEAASVAADPQLVDASAFRAGAGAVYDPHNADLGAASPARGAGSAQSAFTVNFAGAPRSSWNIGAY